MKETKNKTSLFPCLTALLLIVCVKYWRRFAGSNELDWLLAPTARWVEILSGLSFEKIPHLAYLNHSVRLIIAPSCSGIQFMLIAFAVLSFPFLPRIKNRKREMAWLALSLPVAYLYAIGVNGIRIVLSVCLPPMVPSLLRPLPHSAAILTWLTAKRLHTLIGATVSLIFLFLLYRIAGLLFNRIFSHRTGQAFSASHAHPYTAKRFVWQYLPPLLCYFSIVLGIPLFGRIRKSEWDGFADFALLTAAACLAALLPFCLTAFLRRLK